MINLFLTLIMSAIAFATYSESFDMYCGPNAAETQSGDEMTE